jgi:hypothetical protein
MKIWRNLIPLFIFLFGIYFQANAQEPLEVSYFTETTHQSQYNVCMTLKNTSDKTILSWKADFDIPQGQSINYLANGHYSSCNSISDGNHDPDKQHVTVTNEDLTKVLEPNESLSIRFQVNNPQGLNDQITSLYAEGNELPSLSATQSQFALNASYNIDNSWPSGYQVTVTLTNNTSTPTTSWSSSFTLPTGQNISDFWNGVYQASRQQISVSNPTWSGGGTIGAFSSTTYGMVIQNPNNTATQLNNLQALGNPSPTPPTPTVPSAPVLNAITVSSTTPNNYTVSWQSVANATAYTLQQDVTSSFSNPKVVAQGSMLSQAFTNQPNGTYYYRVCASNSAGTGPFSNVQSVTINVQPIQLASPVLNPINDPSGTNQYLISWSAVPNAQGYSLEESTSSNFSSFNTIYNGAGTSFQIVGKALGTYYYRVIATATNATSSPSNIESVTVTNVPPSNGIEHSAWYIDWTSWFTGPPFVIPKSNNVLNIFVGELMLDSNGNPTLGGFGNLTLAQLDEFTAYCAAQQPPIGVKVSIGGSGGMYDNTWDVLTASNVQAFAQGMVNFCHTHGLIGVDFDYEEYASTAQETLVGTLIKNFKTIDPKLQTSLCTNAGFGPNYPWQAVVQTILNAATIAPGNCAVDRLYIMSYYNPIQDEENWILGWANWLEQNYGFTPARVSVGIDDFDASAYDPVAFAAWAASQGFSTAHWAFDPARPKYVSY